MKIRTTWHAFMTCALASTLGLTGCSDDDGGGGIETDAGAGTTTSTSGASQTSASSATTTSAGDGTTSTTGAPDSSGSTDDTASDDGPDPLPNGSECDINRECVSGFCFAVDLFDGICGECLTDADCENGGCSIPNPLADPPVGATCNDGGLGAGCMDSAVCQDGLTCSLVLSAPALGIDLSTCSECDVDADCSAGQLCSPTIDISTVTGHKACVDPGTVPDAAACDFANSGDQACASGVCAEFNVMNLVTVGICGECEVDGDCDPGQICLPPELDLLAGTVTPPICG